MSSTVRISQQAKETLAEMAEESRRPMTDLLDEAVDQLRRKRFLEALNRQFAELRRDPEAWAKYEAERREWEGALVDDLRDN